GSSGMGGHPPRSTSAPLARQSPLVPAPNAAVERDHVPIAHLLEVVADQRTAETAAAVAHDRCVLVGDRLLDVAFDHALAEMDRAGQVALGPFVVFTHIDQDELLAARE